MKTETISMQKFREISYFELMYLNSKDVLNLLNGFAGIYCKILSFQNSYILIRTNYFSLSNGNEFDFNGQLFYYSEIHNELPDYDNRLNSFILPIATATQEHFEDFLYKTRNVTIKPFDDLIANFFIHQLIDIYYKTNEKEIKNLVTKSISIAIEKCQNLKLKEPLLGKINNGNPDY